MSQFRLSSWSLLRAAVVLCFLFTVGCKRVDHPRHKALSSQSQAAEGTTAPEDSRFDPLIKLLEYDRQEDELLDQVPRVTGQAKLDLKERLRQIRWRREAYARRVYRNQRCFSSDKKTARLERECSDLWGLR